jgi:ABC-type multidrug transport system fused ATPase/permease subunit
MDPFWTYARRMLRYRRLVAAAMVCAIVSAAGVATGLVAIKPVLGAILDPSSAKNLPQLAADFNANGHWPSWFHWRIPQGWIDSLPQGRFQAVLWIIVGLGVLTVIGGAANFGHAFLSLTVVQRTVAGIRREAFHRVLRLPLKDVVGQGATDKISRIVNDTGVLESGFSALLSKAVSQFFRGMAAFVAAFIVEWRLTLGAIVVAPLLYAIIRKLGKRVRRASRSAAASNSLLLSAATEAMQGLRVVKVHTNERYEAGRFHRINKDVMGQMFKARTAKALASPLIEVMAIVVLGSLSLIAAKAIIDGNLKPENFILAIVALAAAGEAMRPLTSLANDIQHSSGAAIRIKELMDAAPEAGHDKALPRLARHGVSIEFRDVTFTYPNAARPSLDHVGLVIKHGQRVAIVGPNGSGKTTLLALVPRLFDPNEGAVIVDGQDIRKFSVRSLRRQIGVVTQETVLFKGTIRSNIAYGADDATPERIGAAARMARADGFIESLPQGYDTPVGEQGLTLSGGQRQRIAIARAILRDPAILILDEATSMIDADSEGKIAEALDEFAQGRTCLIVAHRLSTVVSADQIVVMDQGRIVDVGRHEELLGRCATYRLIAERQLVRGDGTTAAPETPRATEDPARPDVVGRISAG